MHVNISVPLQETMKVITQGSLLVIMLEHLLEHHKEPLQETMKVITQGNF